MKTRYFFLNKDGKVEFTKKELDKLLEDVYDEGYTAGKAYGSITYYPSYVPYVPVWYNTPTTKTSEVWCSGSTTSTSKTVTISSTNYDATTGTINAENYISGGTASAT